MALHYINNLKENSAEAKELIKLISSGIKIMGLDTETNGLDPFTCQLLLVQIGIGENVYVMNRGGLGREFFKNLIYLINKNKIVCVGHNIKFDSKVLRTDTEIWLENLYDTMIVESLITAGIGEKLTSLATLVNKYAGVVLSKNTRLEFVELNQNSVFTEQQINYAGTDIIYLLDIYEKQMDEVIKSNLNRILDLELELIPNVCKMEYKGILIDKDKWIQLTKQYEQNAMKHLEDTKDLLISSINVDKFSNALQLADAMCIPVKTKRDRTALELITNSKQILTWIKDNFNVGSPKQLKTAINLAGIDAKDTNEKTLNKLPPNALIDSILQYREFEKLISTYGYNILDLINPVTGRIHTEYFQLGTATGRFSSSHPNLQNIPPKLKVGFISKPGYSFIAMDYSQQEYRLAGALSREPSIIEAYKRGFDMHTASAANKFKKEFKDVTGPERKFGKTMNFAVIYGTTIYGLKRNFSISLEESQNLLDDYWAGYPSLAKLRKLIEDKIIELGFSVTPMGRRRYFKEKPVFATPYELDRYYSQMKREGFNMVIQGGGADITKLAMNKLAKDNPFGDKFSMLLQTHDEIVAEVEDSILDEAFAFMKDRMEAVFQPFLGDIPALVEGKIGKTWGKEE